MLTIGPFVYFHNNVLTWLEITIADNGKCSEIKQASTEEILVNHWNTLMPDQWPSLIPVYDPSVSQSHFILTRNEDDTITRYYLTKMKLQNDTQLIAKDPVYRVMGQTYTGTYVSSAIPLQDKRKKGALVKAYWVPNEEQEVQLKAQYQTWEQQKSAAWHFDPGYPTNNQPNQVLDFQSMQNGELKAPIETNLNAHQQWKVKTALYDTLALLKSESASSSDYVAALHHLINGTVPEVPFSETMKQNIEEVSQLISTTGINNNQHLRSDFYTKLVGEGTNRRKVALSENDEGHDVTLASVISYIDQLLTAEIHQFFPDYVVTIKEPLPFTTNYKIGGSSLKNAEEIEQTSQNLSPEEIQQIDNLLHALSNFNTLAETDDQTLTTIATALNNIIRRQAITIRVADTLSLILNPNNETSFYETKLNQALLMTQSILGLRQLFREILTTHSDSQKLTELNSPDIIRLFGIESVVIQLIKQNVSSDQIHLLDWILQQKILSDNQCKLVLEQFDEEVKKTIFIQRVNAIVSPENPLYSSQLNLSSTLYTALTNENARKTLPIETIKSLSSLIDQLSEDEIIGFLLPSKSLTLIDLKNKINYYFLEVEINTILESNDSKEKQRELLKSLIPIINNKNEEQVIAIIQRLSEEKQLMVLRFLLDNLEWFDRTTAFSCIYFFQKFNLNILNMLQSQEFTTLSAEEQIYYKEIINFLHIKDNNPLENMSNNQLQILKKALGSFYTKDGYITKLGLLLVIYNLKNTGVKVDFKQLQYSTSSQLLSNQLKVFYRLPNDINKNQEIKHVLPDLSGKTQTYYELSELLSEASSLCRALTGFTDEQQSEIVLTLFNTQEVNSHAAQILGKLSSPVLLNLIKQLSSDKITPLFESDNVVDFLRHLFERSDSSALLSNFSENTLDKLMPRVTVDRLELYFKDDPNLSEFPHANTSDWKQAQACIVNLFSHSKAKASFIEKIQKAISPKELKALLIHEVAAGNYYGVKYYVFVAFQRLAEHESALLAQASPEEKRIHQQVRSCGVLSETLMLELHCLQSNTGCETKLAAIKAALQDLPEQLNDEALQNILTDTNHPLTQALFAPTVPRHGFSFFEQKKQPEPDFAILAEIKARIETPNLMFSRIR